MIQLDLSRSDSWPFPNKSRGRTSSTNTSCSRPYGRSQSTMHTATPTPPYPLAPGPCFFPQSDCLLHGLEFLDFLVKTVYEANTSLSAVVSWLDKEWFHAVG